MYEGKITIRPTRREELENVRALWNDGDVMQYVGFPHGLDATAESMERWYDRIASKRPLLEHYSVFAEGIGYCGESYYRIDTAHENAAVLDIKLFSKARGREIASAALQYAIEQAFVNGAACVWVDPNPENRKALALYRRLGFSERETSAYLKRSAVHGGVPSRYFEICSGEVPTAGFAGK